MTGKATGNVILLVVYKVCSQRSAKETVRAFTQQAWHEQLSKGNSTKQLCKAERMRSHSTQAGTSYTDSKFL